MLVASYLLHALRAVGEKGKEWPILVAKYQMSSFSHLGVKPLELAICQACFCKGLLRVLFSPWEDDSCRPFRDD